MQGTTTAAAANAAMVPFLQGITLPKLKWIALLAFWFGYPQPELKYEQDILPLARQWANNNNNNNNNKPLEGVVVVITGATSGIGMGLTHQLSNLGATVIALGRSSEKLKSLQQKFPGSIIVPIQCQLDDLESVQKASKEIASRYDSIDILINNAGTNCFMADNNVATKQNIDISFGVNYLSHFLLTELMIPLLAKSKFQQPTIVQVSSSFHWAVNGSELAVPVNKKNNGMPIAAKPNGLTGILFKAQRAYANSKLAQILHARALQRRRPTITIRSICPGWVSTPIIGSLVQSIMLSPFAFPSNGFGIKSALYAIFLPRKQQQQAHSTAKVDDDDFYTNTGTSGLIHWLPKMIWSPLAYRLRLRDLISTIYGAFMLQTQRFVPYIKARKSSMESYNEELQEDLYQWSYQTVKAYI